MSEHVYTASDAISLARNVVLSATDRGWKGPPFDPIQLASLLKIKVMPRADIPEARTIPLAKGRFRIEYNPNRPQARTRFSIAHEIAHTLLPGASAQMQHRAPYTDLPPAQRRLEVLCNIIAAEILMPLLSLGPDAARDVSIDSLLQMQERFAVSLESIALRVVQLTGVPCFMFAASPRTDDPSQGYHVDYAVPARTCERRIPKTPGLPSNTLLSNCTAIGYTAKGKERWKRLDSPLDIECAGVPPYPKMTLPRVVGIARLRASKDKNVNRIKYLRGDATKPHADGPAIIAFVVNDKTPNWGGGFAKVVKQEFPLVQEEFRHWARTTAGALKLGNAYLCSVTPELACLAMVAQHGYRPSTRPTIRYSALGNCLEQLARTALNTRASVHMPTIGCGQAGGSWEIVSRMIDDILCSRNIVTNVYELPQSKSVRESAQRGLFP